MVEARNRNVSSVGGCRFSFRHKLLPDVSSICDQSPSVRHLFYNYISGRKDIFYLTTHSTHFIYDYMASVIYQMPI